MKVRGIAMHLKTFDQQLQLKYVQIQKGLGRRAPQKSKGDERHEVVQHVCLARVSERFSGVLEFGLCSEQLQCYELLCNVMHYETPIYTTNTGKSAANYIIKNWAAFPPHKLQKWAWKA